MKIVFRVYEQIFDGRKYVELLSTRIGRTDGIIPRVDEKVTIGERTYNVYKVTHDHDKWVIYIDLHLLP